MLGQSRHGPDHYLIIRQPDGTRAHLPQWMTLPTAVDVPTQWPPRQLLSSLLALRRELDAVLSSSTTALPPGGVDEANPAAVASAGAVRPVRHRVGAPAPLKSLQLHRDELVDLLSQLLWQVVRQADVAQRPEDDDEQDQP